jgi:hypothetical protein
MARQPVSSPLKPASLTQPSGIKQLAVFGGHLDDAIFSDGDMPARQGLDRSGGCRAWGAGKLADLWCCIAVLSEH